MASLGTSGQSVTEYVVRVPRNPSKKYSLMGFNAADKVDFSTWNQARMERDLSAKKMYQEEEMPESGAGSEYNRKQREESRRKKYGIILREFKVDDQPWILRVNGKAGRKYKGVKKGGVTENASYFIFTQCADGAFEAFPVSNWYNFTPVAKHRTLTAEEAEQEWERRNKVLNHFTIMQQRRLKDQVGDDDDDEEGGGKLEKGGKGKKKKKKSDLKIHDLEDDLEMSSTESENSDEDGESRKKPQKKAPAKGGKKKKKKEKSDDEALEDSDDGDFEGQEVDYMSDESSSDEELPGKIKPVKEEEGPKGLDEQSESSEESEEEKAEEEEAEEEKKAPTPQDNKKKKKGDSSDESETSEDSDIDGASSSLFMQKKKTPPKKDKKGGSNSSSRGNSRPGTPSPDTGNTSSTLRAAASKLEQSKRGTVSNTPAAKRLKMEAGPQNTSGKSTPQPQSGKSTPSSGDIQLTEEAVRRYLTRKPMTTKDLLKKFQTKKTGLSSEQTVNVLAQILKRLNPDRKIVHDKMHFYLKE